jgi:hypothetical protein
LLGIPDPTAGFTQAGFGVVLHSLIARIDQLNAIQQRGVHRVRRFARKIGKLVKAAQPVTFLLQTAVVAALAGTIKQLVMRTTVKTDFLQYQQAWIGQCLK